MEPCSTTPVKVPGLPKMVDVAVGDGTCAISEAGEVYCWGGLKRMWLSDDQGRADGGAPPTGAIVRVHGLVDIRRVEMAGGFVCARDGRGEIGAGVGTTRVSSVEACTRPTTPRSARTRSSCASFRRRAFAPSTEHRRCPSAAPTPAPSPTAGCTAGATTASGPSTTRWRPAARRISPARPRPARSPSRHRRRLSTSPQSAPPPARSTRWATSTAGGRTATTRWAPAASPASCNPASAARTSSSASRPSRRSSAPARSSAGSPRAGELYCWGDLEGELHVKPTEPAQCKECVGPVFRVAL